MTLLNNIQEKKMGKKFKVRSFPGCVMNDLYFHITPLLLKQPSSIIIMAGTNDAIDKTSRDIFDDLMLLKKHIENEAPACRVLISCPPPRFDYGYAQLTIRNLQLKLKNLNKDHVILNDYINKNHISRKGVHLNGKGSGRLAMNFLSHIRSKN